MDEIRPEVVRNIGFISYEEQEKLAESSVAIAGAGGDGGELAETLVRMGVGEIRLADPEVFETENINRQAYANSQTIGSNKAKEVGAGLKVIYPDAKITIFPEGVTEQNVEEFVEGVDLLIDETEFTLHAIGTMLARQARKEGIPNLMAMNTGFGASVTTYAPDSDTTFESVLGLSREAPIEAIAGQHVPLENWLAYLPEYVDLEMFQRVASGEMSAPTLVTGVKTAASIGSTEAFLNLVYELGNNRREPHYAPNVFVSDPMTGYSAVIGDPKRNIQDCLNRIVTENAAGRVPKASF